VSQAELREQFDALVERLSKDERVLGVVLSGSRARHGTATRWSDYDVLIVVADGQETHLSGELRRDAEFDVAVTPLAAFRRHALAGSEFAWDRYSYVYAQVVHDPSGLIAGLVAEKGALSEQEATDRAPALLDQFLNSVYRTLKNERDGRGLAARMDAAEAIRPMIGYVFALDRRVEPYNKYLEWELERYPLPIPGWDLASVQARITALLGSPSPADGARLAFAAVEDTARSFGHSEVLDGWGDDLRLMRGDTPTVR
jgi:predicted nucleotidyltransferase